MRKQKSLFDAVFRVAWYIIVWNKRGKYVVCTRYERDTHTRYDLVVAKKHKTKKYMRYVQCVYIQEKLAGLRGESSIYLPKKRSPILWCFILLRLIISSRALQCVCVLFWWCDGGQCSGGQKQRREYWKLTVYSVCWLRGRDARAHSSKTHHTALYTGHRISVTLRVCVCCSKPTFKFQRGLCIYIICKVGSHLFFH